MNYIKLNQSGVVHVLLLLAVIGVISFLAVSSYAPLKDKLLSSIFPKDASQAAETWAFEETFDVGAPTSPSQQLLPRTFDFSVTHRNHPNYPQSTEGAVFPADHDEDCTFDGTNAKQHDVTSSHLSTSFNPDKTFFLCNNHMMSSMGDIEGYSVATFWPRQEFDFTGGGTLEFDVNLNWQSRNWFEVVIMPRNEFQIAPAVSSLPIDEEYPKNRLVFRFASPTGGARDMHVGVTEPSNGDDHERNREVDWGTWVQMHPEDPGPQNDRRIRRKNIIKIEENKITWSIQKLDGTFDDLVMNVPEGLPFHRGLVEFKTHAYTPDKDDVIHHRHTHHWDNIRFSGPKLVPFESFESPDVIALMAGPGATKTQTINLPRIGSNMELQGQVMWRIGDQTKLSINGSPNITVIPHSGAGNDESSCFDEGWSTFIIPLQPSQLRVGANTFKWTVGPRPTCATWHWDGFNVKGTEVQMDELGSGTPIPSSSLSVSPSSSPSLSPTLSPSPSPSPTKKGDLNNDGRTNVLDLSQMLSNWGMTGTNTADLNNDQRVNVLDLSIMLSNWG